MIYKSFIQLLNKQQRHGPYTAVYNRFNRWAKQGVWLAIFDPTWTVEQNKTGTRADKPLILRGRLGDSEECSENILAVGTRNR